MDRMTHGRLIGAVLTAIAVFAGNVSAVASTPELHSEAARRAVSSASLPVLESEPKKAERPSSLAGSIPRPGARSQPEAVAELVERRDANTRVFRNDDGSLTIQSYSTPIHYQTNDGAWTPIDNTLRPIPGRAGWVTSSGNAWSAQFGPAGGGFELSTPVGRVSVVPTWTQQNPALESIPPVISQPTKISGPLLPKEELAQTAVPEPVEVTYRGVGSGVDLRYEVQETGIKEDIILMDRHAPAEYAFEVSGTTLSLTEDGGAGLSGPVGELFRIPPPTVLAADGSDVTAASGAQYELDESNGVHPGTRFSVSLNRDWLARQGTELFPLAIDPSVTSSAPSSTVSYSDIGGVYGGSGIQIGRDSSGRVWRAGLHFDEYECCLSDSYHVDLASLYLDPVRTSADGIGSTSVRLFDVGSAPTGWSQIGGTEIWSDIDEPAIDLVGGEVLDTMRGWVTNGEPDQWVGVRGTETGLTARQYDAHLNLRVYERAAPSVVTNITDDQVLSTTTPVFQAQTVSAAADDGTPPMYGFQITTEPVPGSGIVIALGSDDPATGTSWTVPQGVLREGQTYYVWVWTDWFFWVWPPPPVEGRRFTVDLGLGEGGPAPTDEIGSVPGSASSPAQGAPSPSLPASKLTVNMINGNLSMSLGTKKLQTLSGGVALGFTYNSLLASQDRGLRAEFFNDINANGQIDDGVDQLVLERTDATVLYDEIWVNAWEPSMGWLARWTGALTLPPGTWELGAISSDGLKITSGSTVLLDRWAAHDPESDPVFGTSFTAQAGMPIKIEWRASDGSRVAHVMARQNGAVYDLSPTWLSRSARSLPFGWALNADATSARWLSVEDHGTSVVGVTADGSGHEFIANEDGTFAPPLTAPTDLLSRGDSGRFVLQTVGQVYTFRPDGMLESVVTVADNANPVALEYGYSGSPLRLRTITDLVSDRTVELFYGGGTECGSIPSAAIGLLCQIAYWDGTVSDIRYDWAGRLIRFVHPGDIVYDLAYDASKRLTTLRDPLAADAVAAGVRAENDSVLTEITYDEDDGRVAKVTQPSPTAESPWPQRTYTYSEGETEVDVAGFSPSVGFAERVRYDTRNRITERTDSAGLTTTYMWDTQDRLVATTDPAGLRTTKHYDHRIRPTLQYGPAPATSFDTNGFPLAGHTVPLSTIEYDGGIDGLAATYWANPYLAGAPSLHGTGLGTGGAMDRDWNTTLPVVPGSGGWSARFTGDVDVTTADSYTWKVQTRGSLAKVWVDDNLVVDHNQAEPATGWVSTTGVSAALSAGPHRIRVEMVDTSGPAGLQVLWARIGAPTFVALPGNALAPDYGLLTALTDPDGKVTRTEYADTVSGIGPHHRRPTVTVTDPAGANLRTVTTYEPPGASSYLRRVGRTLPAGNAWTFENYGGTEPPTGGAGGAAVGVRGSTSAANTVTSTLTVNRPTGVTAGDVLIAGIGNRGTSSVSVTPPSGWTLIRSDHNGGSMRLSSYVRVAGGSEPANYTWNFVDGGATAKAAAGTITAYTGVDTATPVNAHGGQFNTTATVGIVAPSITTTVTNAQILGLFAIDGATTISPPSGMTERGEAASDVSGQAKITTEAADVNQASAGSTGAKSATAADADRTNAQLIALRPASLGACGVTSATPQGGQVKRATAPDPDGAGSQLARAEEFVYDSVGRQVGRRIGTTATVGTAPWSCTTYDSKGRMISEAWPAQGDAPARTVTYTYAVGGNPLVNAVTDSEWAPATVTATVDLLGRTVSYSDIYGDTTTTQYDQPGRVTNTTGPAGSRTQSYTSEGRAGAVQIDGVTMATPGYHATNGRLTSVAYANGTTTTFSYDTFGHSSAVSTDNSTGTITGDQVTLSPGGRVQDQSVYTGSGYVDANPTGVNFDYDGAGRLTSAKVPGTTYDYGYGTGAGCTAPDAGKNTNRAALTITGTGAASKSYCYDHADRLLSSTDHAPGTVVYDTRGNTTRLAGEFLDFDASDRHTRTESPANVTGYRRDPLNRIVERVDITRTTHLATATGTNQGTSVTVNRPAGTQAGDLIVAALTIADAGTLTAPGWTVAATELQGTQRTWALWRYAANDDPTSWTFTSSGSTTDLAAALMTYRGPTAAAPIALTATDTTTASTAHPLPQVAPTTDAHQLVHVVGFTGNITGNGPSGTTERASLTAGASLLVNDRYQSRPGSSSAADATSSSTVDSASLTVAIVPATTGHRLGHAGHTDSPSHLDDSTGTLIERYLPLPGGVTVTETATSQSAVAFSDDFTGTTGAAWNSTKWSATSNDTTKKVDIDSNQGRLYVSGSSTRATAVMDPITDSEATFSYRFSDRNATSFLRVALRASGATAPSQLPDAYRLEVRSDSDTVKLQRFQGSSATTIGQFSYTQDTSTHKVRLRVDGSAIKVKIWAASSAEPGTWTHETTDSAITAAGVLQVAHSHTTGTRSVYLDDLAITGDAAPRTWSYPNLHGDTIATADNTGTRTWIGWHGPYGESPAGMTAANATAAGTTWGWHGQQQRLTDRSIIHMGARPYSSDLGRFLAVDPVEGGCLNDYVYVADPVNQADLNGRKCPGPVKAVAGFLGWSFAARAAWRLAHGDVDGTLDALSGGVGTGATTEASGLLHWAKKSVFWGTAAARFIGEKTIKVVVTVAAWPVGLGATGVEMICQADEVLPG